MYRSYKAACDITKGGNRVVSSSTDAASITPSSPLSPYLEGKGPVFRGLAYLIDGILRLFSLLPLVLPGSFTNAEVMRTASEPQPFGVPWVTVGALLVLLSFPAYFILFEGLHGVTPGKLLCGMRVVRRDGQPCGLLRAGLRQLLRPIDNLVFGLPALLLMHPPCYQRLGDHVARTIVITAERPLDPPAPPVQRFLLAGALYLLLVVGGGVLLTIPGSR